MGGVRVLVGTRKGAFVLTSDEGRRDWRVEGPHFAGWEIYHLAGSPADPDRVWASQSSGWFGQVVHRSDDGARTWEAVGNDFRYAGETAASNAVWWQGSGRGVLVQADLDGDARADFEVFIKGYWNLTEGDFIL